MNMIATDLSRRSLAADKLDGRPSDSGRFLRRQFGQFPAIATEHQRPGFTAPAAHSGRWRDVTV